MSAPIAQYHLPGVIVFIIIIILAISLGVSGCSMCCTSIYFKSRLHRKYAKMKSPSKLKKGCAIACLLIPTILSSLCIYVHIAGSNYFSQSIIDSKGSVVQLLKHADAFFIDLAPNFGTSLDTLKLNIDESIDKMTSHVNFDDFTVKVAPAFTKMINAMYSIEKEKEKVIADYPGIIKNTTFLQVNATNLRLLVQIISASVAKLSKNNSFQVDPYKNDVWALLTPVETKINADSIKSSADNSPDTEKVFGSLRTSTNLTISGNNIKDKIDSGISSAKEKVTNSSSGRNAEYIMKTDSTRCQTEYCFFIK